MSDLDSDKEEHEPHSKRPGSGNRWRKSHPEAHLLCGPELGHRTLLRAAAAPSRTQTSQRQRCIRKLGNVKRRPRRLDLALP
jgi:hypothetical protein